MAPVDSCQQGVSGITNINEIAQYKAILIERDALAGAGNSREQADDPSVGVYQRLARTINILKPCNIQPHAKGGRPR